MRADDVLAALSAPVEAGAVCGDVAQGPFGATFTCSRPPHGPATEADPTGEEQRWATRDKDGEMVEWPTEEDAREYVARRVSYGMAEAGTEAVLHRELPPWREVTADNEEN